MTLGVPRLLQTAAFRLALGYLCLFSLSVAALLAFVYWNTAVFVAHQTDETIRAEIQGLAERYNAGGITGLGDVVQSRARGQKQSLYLLTFSDHQPIAGNLSSWPGEAAGPAGWISFDFQRDIAGKTEVHTARARTFDLTGGFHLLVGRDIQDRLSLEERLKLSMIWAFALTLAIGLAGGVLTARSWSRRIERINRTTREIMGGDLAQRVPVGGSGDELDRLATNLNDMLERIEDLMASMRQVTDNIAHDLRSPLQRLRTRLDVTLLEDPEREGYREALVETVEEAESLLKTFNALLLIGETEAGLARDQLETVDLAEMTRDAAELYEPAAEDKEVRLEIAADGALPLEANHHLLAQAIANLLDNAVKYTPAGGEVRVGAYAPSADRVAVCVADTGPGIPEEARETVRRRFVRLESSRRSAGSGLGLSLVDAVARMHGGELRFEDAEPGLRAELILPTRPNTT